MIHAFKVQNWVVSGKGVQVSLQLILEHYLSLCPSDLGGRVPRVTAARVGRMQFIVHGVWSLTLTGTSECPHVPRAAAGRKQTIQGPCLGIHCPHRADSPGGEGTVGKKSWLR